MSDEAYDSMSEIQAQAWFRARAREIYQKDGMIEVDENASVSLGDDPGAYVQAWVWVPLRDEED